jgi:hypothetical protein
MAGLLLAGVLGMPEAKGQVRVLSGPSAGIEFALASDVEGAWSGAPWSLYPMGGSSSSRIIRFGSEMVLPELFPGIPLSLGARVGLASGSETYHSDAVPGPPVAGLPSVLTDSFSFSVESSSLSGELDLRARYALGRSVGIGLGPWIGYQFFSRFTYRDTVVDTLTGRFGAAVVRDGSDFGVDPLHYGVVFSVPVTLPLGEHGSSLVVEPYLRADLAMLPNRPTVAPISLGADLSYLFDMNPAPLPVSRPDPPPVVPPPQPLAAVPEPEPPLAAKIDIYSVNAKGERMQVSELYPDTIMQRRQMPFPGAIFFDRDSSAPPARYVRYDRDASESFSFGTLAGLSPRDIYYHALNILGYRMRRYPASRARLIGSRSKDEPGALARSRAEAVRDYLLATWGIDSARLSVATESMVPSNALPADAERCVRIETARPVGAPLTVEWKTRRFRQPTFDLQPEIRAKEGVKRWEIVVRQGGREIGRTSGSAGLDLALHTPEDLADTVLPPLEAELMVEDSAGATVFARDTLPLRIMNASPPEGSSKTIWETSSYLLLGAAYGHQGESPAIGASLRQIADSIGNGARVTVVGPGRDARQARPALRTEEVAGTLRTLLGGRGVDVSTAITPAMSLDSQYPEERMLAAGVSITIEQ